MSAQKTLKEVIRATRVPPEQAAEALEKIRKLVGAAPARPEPIPETEQETTREERGGSDRLHRSGSTRSTSKAAEKTTE